MDEIPEKYLPIGTVVLLNGGTKRVMITGFCSSDKEDGNEKIWDYCGCLYPEGVINSNEMCLFNHSQITKLYHLGLSYDDEEIEFKKLLNEISETLDNKWKNYKNGDKINNVPTSHLYIKLYISQLLF